jgi:hypothetical protein
MSTTPFNLHAFPQSDRNFGTHRNANISSRRVQPWPATSSHFNCLLYIWHFSIRGVGWDRVHSVRRPLAASLYQLPSTDQCAAVSGVRPGTGKRCNRRKLAPIPLCSTQIPHDLTRYRTRAVRREAGNQPPELSHGLLLRLTLAININPAFLCFNPTTVTVYMFPVPCDESKYGYAG